MEVDYIFIRRLASAAVPAAVIVGLLTVPPVNAARCSPDMVTEKTSCAKRIPKHHQTPAQKREKKDRAQAYQDAHHKVSPRPHGRATIIPKDPKPLRPKFALPEMAPMRLYKEGEGNGGLTYTCGPSSMRNMLAALYKHKTGHYKDLGERRLMAWAGTRPVGTARGNIATGLNNHVPNLGYWETFRPHDADNYLSWVVSSTAYLGRAVIANVDTSYLDYFHRKRLMHFNLVFGYDFGDRVDKLLVGEEWSRRYYLKTDPKTGRRIYFNPYGKHWVPLAHAYSAIMHPSNHGIVA